MGKWIVVGIVAVLVAANYRADAQRTITCDELAKTLGDNMLITTMAAGKEG